MDAQLKRNPFWTARATLEAYYGFIVDLPIVGRLSDGHDTLFSVSKEVAHSGNRPPKIIVQRPSWLVDLGQPLSLGFFLLRQHLRRDGLLCRRSGGRGCFVHPHLRQGRPAPEHELHLRDRGAAPAAVAARDSEGATSTASFTVDVVNTPPVVYGSAGTTTTPQTVPVYIAASASDPNSQVDCSALTWSVQAPDTVEPQNLSADACQARAVFNVKGTRHVTLLGRDPQGARALPCLHHRGHRSTRESPADHRPDALGEGGKPGRLRCPGDPGERPGVWPALLLAAGDRSGRRDLRLHRAVLRLPEPRAEHPADLRSNTTGVSSFLPPQTGTWRFGARATDGLSPGVSFSRTVVSVPAPLR